MKQAAELAVELGFDGIDLNMGCPDKSICRQGAGCAMIKTPDRARQVIEATMEGAGTLPVSVKTRAGYSSDDELEDWMTTLLLTHPAEITLHARTRKNMSKVPARWELLPAVVKLRDELSPYTLILGNGDVASLEQAYEQVKKTGVDGAMIGRGIFGNPWFFNPRIDGSTVPIEEKLRVLVEHARLFEDILGREKPFHLMKKHCKAYVSGFDGAKELRVKLMEAENADDVENTIKKYFETIS
jgi:tRNA-dihydrouridine synthase